MNIKFTPSALAGLRDIHAYFAHFEERAADKVIARIDTAISFLATFPE